MQARLESVEERDGKILIGYAGDTPAGYVVATIEETGGIDSLNKFSTRRGSIDALFVYDEFRGKGVSSALINTIEDFFRESGCQYSEVACLASNDIAHEFYLKKGYQERYINFLKEL